MVRTTGARFSLNMISAVNPRGKMRFMTHKGKMNAAVFCSFLKRMLHNGKRPVFLVLDGHPVHRSLVVRRFVEATKGRFWYGTTSRGDLAVHPSRGQTICGRRRMVIW